MNSTELSSYQRVYACVCVYTYVDVRVYIHGSKGRVLCISLRGREEQGTGFV